MTHSASIPAGAGSEASARPSPGAGKRHDGAPVADRFESVLSGQLQSPSAAAATRVPDDAPRSEDPPADGAAPGSARAPAGSGAEEPDSGTAVPGAPVPDAPQAGSARPLPIGEQATPAPVPAASNTIAPDVLAADRVTANEPEVERPVAAIPSPASDVPALPGVAAPAAVADSIAPELGRFVFGDQPSGSPRRGAAAIGARPVSAKVSGASVAGGEGDAAPSSLRAPIQLDTADVSGGETGPARAAQALPGLPSETAGGEQPTTAPRPSPLSVTGAAPSAVALSDPSLAPSAPRQPIGVNVESPAWGAALGARMVWNVSNGVQSASLDLNPRDLGPVNVLLHVSDDEVSLAFNSQHAVVREAIEAALPRLRDMLASSGFELAGVEIGADPRERGAGERASSGDRDLASGDAGDGSGPASEAELNVRLTDALVDTFA